MVEYSSAGPVLDACAPTYSSTYVDFGRVVVAVVVVTVVVVVVAAVVVMEDESSRR